MNRHRKVPTALTNRRSPRNRMRVKLATHAQLREPIDAIHVAAPLAFLELKRDANFCVLGLGRKIFLAQFGRKVVVRRGGVGLRVWRRGPFLAVDGHEIPD